MLARESVGRTDRLRQAKAAGTAEDKLDCRLQAYTMADRHKHGSHRKPCTEHCTNRLAAINERGPGPALNGRLLKGTE